MTRTLSKLEKQNFYAIGKIEDRYKGLVLKNYLSTLEVLRGKLGKIYEKYSRGGALTLAEMTKYNRLKTLYVEIEKEIGPMFSRNGNLIEKMKKVTFNETFFRYGWAYSQNLGINLAWGVPPKGAIEAAVKNELTKIAQSRLRLDGRVRIRRAIVQGLTQGASYPKMSRQIKDAINGNAKDAMRIVRTEGQRAAVLGQQASRDRAEDIGVEIVPVWDAALDRRTRPAHGALDNRPAQKRDGKWQWYSPSVGWIDGPLQSGVAGFDINCRCRERETVEGISPKLRRTREKGIQKYITYDEWSKEYG